MSKDPIQELIEQAEESEMNTPWNKWPNLWFIGFEIFALIIVLSAAWYFNLHEYSKAIVAWIIAE